MFVDSLFALLSKLLKYLEDDCKHKIQCFHSQVFKGKFDKNKSRPLDISVLLLWSFILIHLLLKLIHLFIFLRQHRFLSAVGTWVSIPGLVVCMGGGLSCRATNDTEQNGNSDQFLCRRPGSVVHSDWSINKYERYGSVFDF